MNTQQQAINAANKLIEDYPYLFNQDEKYRKILVTAIAIAILQFSINEDKYYQSKRESESWQHGTLPPVFEDIINSHFNIKTT